MVTIVVVVAVTVVVVIVITVAISINTTTTTTRQDRIVPPVAALTTSKNSKNKSCSISFSDIS